MQFRIIQFAQSSTKKYIQLAYFLFVCVWSLNQANMIKTTANMTVYDNLIVNSLLDHICSQYSDKNFLFQFLPVLRFAHSKYVFQLLARVKVPPSAIFRSYQNPLFLSSCSDHPLLTFSETSFMVLELCFFNPCVVSVCVV